MNSNYTRSEPSRAALDAMEGPTLVEFGTDWCGYCRAAQPLIAGVLAGHPEVRHLKIEDGPGRALGRSFKVRLWPTLIFVNHGREIARLVRPTDSRTISEALAQQARAAQAAA